VSIKPTVTHKMKKIVAEGNRAKFCHYGLKTEELEYLKIARAFNKQF
jgi:hypothetical protein